MVPCGWVVSALCCFCCSLVVAAGPCSGSVASRLIDWFLDWFPVVGWSLPFGDSGARWFLLLGPPLARLIGSFTGSLWLGGLCPLLMLFVVAAGFSGRSLMVPSTVPCSWAVSALADPVVGRSLPLLILLLVGSYCCWALSGPLLNGSLSGSPWLGVLVELLAVAASWCSDHG